MRIQKFNIYLADLNPRMGTEPGKIRPVVVVQTDLLNETHPSTIICPITTKVVQDSNILRVHLSQTGTGLNKDSDILIDQIRAIDNKRFKKHLGKINEHDQHKLFENLQILIFE